MDYMKICFITDTVFELGGIQRVLSTLANELVEYYDVDILCTMSGFKVDRRLYGLKEKVKVEIREDLVYKGLIKKVFLKSIKVLNSKVGFLNKDNYTNFLTKVYYPKEIQESFVQYLNDKDYDVVIGVAGYYSLLAAIISDKIGAKTIGWQHNSYEAYFRTPNKYQWAQDSLFREHIGKLDKYIVLTDADKKDMEENFKIKCSRIYNPLSFTSNEKSSCEEKKVIFVGRLIEGQKGLDLLIKAFNKVCLNHKDWTLHIVGDGPDKEKINKLINQLKLNQQVKIEPFTNNVKRYYLNSSIFVSSSRWEGFGLVITEAMECGLPVIAFANSGPKEIINRDNVNGILVKCGDIDKLSEAIISLMENEEKRKSIAKESVKRAGDFSMNNIIKQWNEVIGNV